MLKISKMPHQMINAAPDAEVGISLAYLAGNDQFTSYAAEIKPGAHIAAHYHPEGIEIYQIFSGKGLIKTGLRDKNNTVIWDTPVEVECGDFFTIYPNVIHKLENNSSELLILIATCSPNNLDYNRVVIV